MWSYIEADYINQKTKLHKFGKLIHIKKISSENISAPLRDKKKRSIKKEKPS